MDIKENRSSRKKREKQEIKRTSKQSKDLLKGKSKYEKQMIMLINSEVEIISFLLKKRTDKDKKEILKQGIQYLKEKEHPIVYYNLVSLLKEPIRNTTIDNSKPKIGLIKK